jgi:hypothetical protein
MAGLKTKWTARQHECFQAQVCSIQKRREESVTTEHEESVRRRIILEGLIADKSGDEPISTATRILAEVIASDAVSPMVFNGAIDYFIQNNQRGMLCEFRAQNRLLTTSQTS